MVIKSEVVHERLKALADTLTHLNELRTLAYDPFRKEFRNLWAAERGFQIAAEALFDIGNHILAGQFHASPKDYQDIIRLLADHHVINAELASRLKGLGGFRNILVHDYLDVDPGIVYDQLQKGLADFEEFSRQVLVWMDQNKPGR
jgi:uncharacterized protein YutE (UPF0331/DUF86 family)